MVAMHNSKLMEPLGVFYDPKNNIVILHSITNINGLEWEISEKLTNLCKDLKAREIITLEGVLSQGNETKAFFYSNNNKSIEAFKKNKIEPMKEGIVMGVTAALLLKAKCNLSAIFVETHSQLPDSRAAAKIIEILDKYLNLKVDYKPLLAKAQAFESKLKNLIEQGNQAKEEKEKKELNYLG
jgi:predicted ATP-grasp superfamily ATP-dependent carboligase